MEEAMKTRRRVYGVGAVVAGLMWALIYTVGNRLNGPIIRVGVAQELVLGLAGAFCLLAALFVFSMKPKLVDEIIESARRRGGDDGADLTLKAMARQLSLMGAGLGWSVLTAGYIAVSLTGLYYAFGAFVVLAMVVSASAGARIRRLIGYAEQMGIG